jgi:hypothetical protein
LLSIEEKESGLDGHHSVTDISLYGRDKKFHDGVQSILNKKVRAAMGLCVIDNGEARVWRAVQL